MSRWLLLLGPGAARLSPWLTGGVGFPLIEARPVRLLFLWLATAAVSATLASDPALSGSGPPARLVRIGVGPGTWGGINRNDATAAITSWARVIAGHHQIFVEPSTRLFDSTQEMYEAIRANEVEAFSMLSEHFFGLEAPLRPDAIFVSTKNQAFAERYVILVHEDSGLTDLSQLTGRSVVLQTGHRASLAPRWIQRLLGGPLVNPLEHLFKSVTRVENPSRAILQVFFHQADACLVTSNVFGVAAEMNPQLRRRLVTLQTSEPVVPVLFAFHPAFQSYPRHELEAAILDLNRTQAGKQVLTVFQGDGMVKLPATALESVQRWVASPEKTSLSGGTR